MRLPKTQEGAAEKLAHLILRKIKAKPPRFIGKKSQNIFTEKMSDFTEKQPTLV